MLDESILDCFFDAKNDLDYDKPCKGQYQIFGCIISYVSFLLQNIFYYLYSIYNLGTQTKCEEICEETDEAAEQYCYENCETVDVTLAEALFGDNEDNVHVCENI